MGVTNLGRVQGGGFYYADYTPSDADSSIRLGRVWLKPNTVKALIGDHVVMADGSLWEITALSDGEVDLVMALERKTSIRGKKGDTGAQGEAGIGCSINGVPTALDFTSNPQIQLDELKQQNTSQSSQIENLGQTDLNIQSQIEALTNASNFTSLWSGNWTNSNDTAKVIDFSGYKYIVVKGSVGGTFSVMLPVASSTFGFTHLAGSNRNTIYGFNLTITSNSIAWGVAGFYTDGVWQDRTNTGYYNIWEILGVK
ncbi:MAG: hypothetical protein SO434_04335 [Eubacteriales bacterium]|nr:hypothetical protein [Eubacteriales bacterium]